MKLRERDIVLRAWQLDDAPAVEAACQDSEISCWIPFVPSPYTREDAETYARMHRKR